MTGSERRRLVVGRDGQGRSAVTRSDVPGARVVRPNGAVVEEIWRQETLPARAGDDGTRTGEMAPLPPPGGVSVRRFTLPPDDPAGGVLPLGRTPSFYLITAVSGRAYLVLEAGEALLEPGDCVVLPGSPHTWRNPFGEPAVLVSTVLPLAEPLGDGDPAVDR